MKKLIFIFALCNVLNYGYAQNQDYALTTHTQVFSLSPISKKVDKVNGLVFGVGHVENRNISNQTINGLNIEANPAPIAGAMFSILVIMHSPDIIKNKTWKKVDTLNTDFVIKKWDCSPKLKLNGLNISTGCFFVPTDLNGMNISLANKFNTMNGISIAPLGTISSELNGASIGLINANTSLKGLSIGFYNQSKDLSGLHLGIINRVKYNKGVQLGIFNTSYSRGFQLGIWNKNAKRSLPLINW